MSLAAWDAQTPWTYTTLGQEILAHVSSIHGICQSPNEQSSAGDTQATEFTGVYQGAQIHAVIVLSLLAPTPSGLFVGETRSIYRPVSQWSTTA